MVTGLYKSANSLAADIELSNRDAVEAQNRMVGAASAMDGMHTMVIDVAKNAAVAQQTSSETRAHAEEGQKILEKVVESIDLVQNVSQSLRKDMDELHSYTRNISQIMDVISDIADQTNLLALNAAIEAARAGGAGRGFAVVADEVRKLAEKTMASTSDVSEAITSIQSSAEKSVQRMDEALSDVENATALAKQSGDALGKIVESVEKAADQVNTIALACGKEATASEEITQSIGTVKEMSIQTTQAMTEAAKSISQLARQTDALGNASKYEYKWLNKLTKTYTPFVDNTYSVTENSYDKRGNVKDRRYS